MSSVPGFNLLSVTWDWRNCWCWLVVLGAVASAASGVSQPAENDSSGDLQRYQYDHPAMGTVYRLIFYAESQEAANAAAEAVFVHVDALDERLSDYRTDSELNQLSRSAGEARDVPVSVPLWNVLTEAERISRQTGGAFDVTAGPSIRLWRRARRSGSMPARARLQQAASTVGHEHMQLDPSTRRVRLECAGMRLDLGGIAKGFAADEALRLLSERGMRRALVDAGGDLALGEPPPDRPGWAVGISALDAQQPGPGTEQLTLSGCGVATSGDLYQHVVIDGKRYSHLVDPRSGLALTNSTQVTVVAGNCMLADAWASALSVLGPSDGEKAMIDSRASRKRQMKAYLVQRAEEGQKLKRWVFESGPAAETTHR